MRPKEHHFWVQAVDELKREIANMPVRPTAIEVGNLLSKIAKRLRETPEFRGQDNDNPPPIKTSDNHKQE